MNSINIPVIDSDQADDIVGGKFNLPIDHLITPIGSIGECEKAIIDELNRNKLNIKEISELYTVSKIHISNLSTILRHYSHLIHQVESSEELNGASILTAVERSAFHKLYQTQISYLLIFCQSSIDNLIKQRISYDVFNNRKECILENLQAKIQEFNQSSDQINIDKSRYFIEILALEDQREVFLKRLMQNIKDLEKIHADLLDTVYLIAQLNPKKVIIDTPVNISPNDVRVNVELAADKIEKLHDSTTLPIYLSVVCSLLVLPLLIANFNGLPLSDYIHYVGTIALFITVGINYLIIVFTLIRGLYTFKFDIHFKVSFLHIAITVMMFLGLDGIPVKPEADAIVIYAMLIISIFIYIKSLNAFDNRETYFNLLTLLKNQVPHILNDYEATIKKLSNSKGMQ